MGGTPQKIINLCCGAVLFSALIQLTTADDPEVPKDYKGYKVVSLNVDHNEWDDLEEQLQNNADEELDVWKAPTEEDPTAHVMVSPVTWSQVHQVIKNHAIETEHLITDVSRLILPHIKRRERATKRDVSVIGRYASYDEILNWMQDLENMYPELVEVKKLGRTYEGRHLKLIKIGYHRKDKMSFWLDGGIHAREWITPAVVNYIASKIIYGHKSDPELKDLLKKFDFHFAPVINPDGYEYSHSKDRLWRKNRRPNAGNCTGVDLNRNWPFHWGEAHTSSNPCSAVYPGPRQASEAETQHMMRYILARRQHFIGFVSLHSYSQMWLTRWAYTNKTVPEDHDNLMHVAQKGVDAMTQLHGTKYKAGTAPDILYPFSGGSPDWARGVAGINYTYLLELRDEGQFGFLLPQDQIEPTSEEVFAGLMEVWRHIKTVHCYPECAVTKHGQGAAGKEQNGNEQATEPTDPHGNKMDHAGCSEHSHAHGQGRPNNIGGSLVSAFSGQCKYMPSFVVCAFISVLTSLKLLLS